MSESTTTAPVSKLAAARARQATVAPLVPVSHDRAQLLRFAAVLAEIGLLVLLLWKFEVQNPSFINILLLAWGGCAIQHFIPASQRLNFFVAISLAGIVSIVGLQSAVWLLGVGCALIGIAHLPVPYLARVGLMLAAAATLFALRMNPKIVGALAPLWPVIASMFMFRMMIYMYDLKHRAAPFSPAHAFSYFFMLPNVFFPLFPVVDYKTFCRSHMNADSTAIYQKGIEWILRGTVHLLVYRVIYQNFSLGVGDIVTAGQSVQYMVTTFLRYMQVSGNYHIIIGILCLFGFNLPEAFNRWLLPSSFSDFWRRANIYWKDFMQKIFFTPILYLTKGRLGETGALLFATGVTMVVTWAFHDLQTFAVSGIFAPRLQDMIFWGFLGVMILGNIYLETRFGRKRSLTQASWSIRDDFSTGIRVIGMISIVTVAWNYWSASSPVEFFAVLAPLSSITASELGWVISGMVLLGTVGALSHRYPRRQTLQKQGGAIVERSFWLSVATRTAAIGCILAIGKFPLVLAPISADAAQMASTIRQSKLNRRDTQQLERGYYEDLMDPARFNPELAELYADRPVDWNVNPTVRKVPGHYPAFDLIPSISVPYKGAVTSINSHGMRDREYPLAKPPGTIRIALLGSSHSSGVGVGDDETFENIVEDRLNRELAASGSSRRIEILNFSISGYGPVSALVMLEERAMAFSPDLILYTSIDDVPWIANEMANVVEKGMTLPYEPVREMIARSGIVAGLPKVVAEQKMHDVREPMLLWTYRRMVEIGAARGAPSAATFLPRPEEIDQGLDLLVRQAEIAQEAGMQVWDTSRAYEAGKNRFDTLWIAKWDKHPNAEGHRMLADALYPHVKKFVEALP